MPLCAAQGMKEMAAVMNEYVEPHVRTIILMAKHGHLTEDNLRPYLDLIYQHGFDDGAADGVPVWREISRGINT